ncbi:MAG: NTP transferase domain-containing protein [Thermoanaerobaculia bacterium]
MRSPRVWDAAPPLVGGILLGGGSTRMGKPKHLLDLGGETFLERIVRALSAVVAERFLLGSAADLPPVLAGETLLPDAPGARGPLAGLLAALAHRPGAAWLIVACDQPLISSGTLRWLAGERRFDRIAVLPRLELDRVEPVPGIYEPMAREPLLALAAMAPREETPVPGNPGGEKRGASLQPFGARADVLVVGVPPEFRPDFRGANTPAELTALRSIRGRA